MKITMPPNRMAQIVLGFAVIALLVVAVFSFGGVLISQDDNSLVRHSYQVLDALQDLRAAMAEAQLSNRDFALTGAESYLDSYSTSISTVEQLEATVRDLMADNPVQQRRLPALERLTAQKIQVAEMVSKLRRTGGLNAAAAAIASAPDNWPVDEFAAAVQQLRGEELRLLVLRAADSKRQRQLGEAIVILGIVLGLTFTVAAGWFVQRDTRRRGRAEQALQDSEERYRTLLDGVPDYAIVMFDPLGQIVTWNAGAERLLGYTAEEVIGDSVSRFSLPEDGKKSSLERILRVTAADGRYQEEVVRVRKDGSQFTASVTLAALRDRTGKLQGISAISRDISEVTQMEARYRGLLEAAPDAMVVVDQGGEIVLLNLQAEKRFGYPRDELLGQPVTNIIPQGFAERLIADRTRTTAEALAQQIGTGIELVGRRKDGSAFPIELMLSPLASAEGILVTAAIRDITTRKAAEGQLLQKVDELNRSNEELGQFAYIASHDLQEPLRMVASYTQLLSRRYKGRLDPEADEFIAFAVDGATRMQRLIRDLLSYSRVGTDAYTLADTSSEAALQYALKNLQGAIDASDALVTYDPLPNVKADERQLVQLFQNLVGNAIKYQSPGIPRVHISAVRDNRQQWLFSVQDNGLGIEQKYFERIFGMFRRLHKREDFGGTGIGLAICRKIVERHGGTISVESQLGEGSTFRFLLAGSEMPR